MSSDFFRSVGGKATTLSGADPLDPASVIWNFGVMPTTPAVQTVFQSKPTFHQRFPKLVGKWDGKSTINHWEAVKKVLGDKAEDLIQYQPRGTCFPSGTLVLMGDGTQKAIESVSVGDAVVTHTGAVRRVLHTMERRYSGPLTSVVVVGISRPIRMTNEHPVLVTENLRGHWGSKGGYRPGQQNWKEAGNLAVKDRVLVPFGPDLDREHVYDMVAFVRRLADNPGTTGAGEQIDDTHVRSFQGKVRVHRHVRLDERLGRLLGLFLAEGCTDLGACTSGAKTVFTFAGDEELLAAETATLIESLFGVDCRLVHEKKTVRRVVCGSTIVTQFFRSVCGANAYTKAIPPQVFQSSRSVRLAVLRGWLDGDGDLRNRGGKVQIRGVSASLDLAVGMRRLALSCRLHASVIARKKEVHQRVASNDVYLAGQDACVVMPDRVETAHGDGRGRMAYRTDSGFLCPIRSTTEIEVVGLPVYNLEVEEEHSYVADGIAVHNCGGRAGSGSGDFAQCIAIAAGKRAKFHRISHAAVYYMARKLYGMNTGDWRDDSNDGVAGGSVNEALMKLGYVQREEDGDTSWYGAGSDDLACQLGAGMHPDIAAKIITAGSDSVLTDWFPVRSAAELADGIASGGVGLGSDMQGFTMTRDRDGFCRTSGQWSHYQFRMGVGVWNGRKGFPYFQSWGKTTPDGPLLAGCPGNVFGVEFDVMDRIVQNGEWGVVLSFPLFELENDEIDIPWIF